MYVSGYGLNTSYYNYIYNSSANTVGLTSDSMNPVSHVHSGRTQNASDAQGIYSSTVNESNHFNASVSPESNPSKFRDLMSLQYKMLKEQEYEEELEDARINDPAKYERMQNQRKQDIAKSFFQVEEIAKESGDGKTGMAVYNGVAINFDFEHGIMSVGDMSQGNDIIHVGKLSNGYAFSFNRDNIDDISKILDLFSPEDINKIMEAITKDNIAKSMEQEIEDEKAKVGQTAETDENSTAEAVVQDATGAESKSRTGSESQSQTGTQSRDRIDMLAPAIEDLDQSAAVGGKNGIGFSVYYMSRANSAYEDSFVYAR